MNIGNTPVTLIGGVLTWTAGLAVDADGAPQAYSPLGSNLVALDNLGNAGHPGNWWGLITDTGLPTGKPIIQSPSDPAPGYYVSTTALSDRTRVQADPRRYVDSLHVPYLSIPPELRAAGARLGDVARVSYREQWSPAIVADIGPRGKIGEGSIALARALGLNPSPRNGGIGNGVSVWLFVGSSQGWPRSLDSITQQVASLFQP